MSNCRNELKSLLDSVFLSLPDNVFAERYYFHKFLKPIFVSVLQ